MGWAEGVRDARSPHYDRRPSGIEIDTVVLHNISLPPLTFGSNCVEDFFCGRLDCRQHEALASLEGIRVSSHFFIRRNGEMVQFVSCNDRAWHAGLSSLLGRRRCNDFSIGIEIEGTDFCPFEERQYQSLEGLLRAISHRYPVRYIVAHSDIAPTRKTDPGPYFDWGRLMREKACFGSPEFPGAAARIQKSLLEPSSVIG